MGVLAAVLAQVLASCFVSVFPKGPTCQHSGQHPHFCQHLCQHPRRQFFGIPISGPCTRSPGSQPKHNHNHNYSKEFSIWCRIKKHLILVGISSRKNIIRPPPQFPTDIPPRPSPRPLLLLRDHPVLGFSITPRPPGASDSPSPPLNKKKIYISKTSTTQIIF